jgi:hypothetical protein
MPKIKSTERGFAIAEFDDLYGNKCSLQKSSAAMYDAVWFGISNPEINVLMDGQWKTVSLPEGAVIHSRMHLSQKMVRELLPALQHFAEHGELPSE